MKLSQQQLERIVAYLDGELPPDESAQVEQQLAADEQFRQELQGAERAWAALDQLPMATVGDEFSRTTMDLVVVAARQDVEAKTIALPVQRRQQGATMALTTTMAVLLGALVFRVGWQNPNRQLQANLPVIQYVDIYSQFRSVEFLRELNRRLGEATPVDPAEAEQLQASLAEFQLVSAAENRAQWLDLLLADEQVTLRAKYNRFRDLSTELRSQLRELHEQIEAAGDREQLLRTMFRYQQWLNGLPPSEQYKYRELSTSEQLSIADGAGEVATAMKQAASQQRFELTAEQIRELFKQVRPHIQRAVRQRQEDFDQVVSRMSVPEQRLFRSKSKLDQLIRSYQLAIRRSPELMREFNEVIAAALPAEMQEPFRQLPPGEQFNLWRSWFWRARSHAINNRQPAANRQSDAIPEQELADFFVELEPNEKERLLALPREEMQRQLKSKYFGHGARNDWWDRSNDDGRYPYRESPPGGRRNSRRNELGPELGPPPRGPGNGPGFGVERDRRPPRGMERDGPPRRPRPDGPPPE